VWLCWATTLSVAVYRDRLGAEDLAGMLTKDADGGVKLRG
jgi:hypothetical protein